MSVIEKARELGHLIQKSELYTAMIEANAACDASQDLQAKIENFNQLRADINTEIMSDKKDPAKVAEMDAELRDQYNIIMNYPEMLAFNNAKTAFNEMITFANQIISESANGANPDSVEKSEGCGGSCSSCGGGCH